MPKRLVLCSPLPLPLPLPLQKLSCQSALPFATSGRTLPQQGKIVLYWWWLVVLLPISIDQQACLCTCSPRGAPPANVVHPPNDSRPFFAPSPLPRCCRQKHNGGCWRSTHKPWSSSNAPWQSTYGWWHTAMTPRRHPRKVWPLTRNELLKHNTVDVELHLGVVHHALGVVGRAKAVTSASRL